MTEKCKSKKIRRDPAHVCDRCECLFSPTPGCFMTITKDRPHHFCQSCTVQIMEDASVGKMLMTHDPEIYRMLSDEAVEIARKINNFMSQH